MLGYVTGVYDILRSKDLQKLDEIIQKNKESGNEYFSIAVYEDELCEKMGLNTPLKNVEDRLKIIEQISGVDFAFSISSLDKKIVKQKAEEAFKKYKEEQNKNEKTKKYDIVYSPGTYDLFHAGHLENLLEASKQGKKLVVGVKSDELVKAQKGDYPRINAEERKEILRHFKFVDNVYEFYTRDLHVASEWIKSKYGKAPEAIFCGSDLKKDYKNIKDLNIVYTDRDPAKMGERSTSGYKKKLKLQKMPVNGRYNGNIAKTNLEDKKLNNIKIDENKDDLEK